MAQRAPSELLFEIMTLRLMKKNRPEFIPVTARSIALFRLGEQCNNDCPMCSNSGRPEAFSQPREELVARADHLYGLGFRRVMVTGGEPTIHPGFWGVVALLVEKGIAWDLNTHGRSFSDMDFARRAFRSGLRRSIVSFHSHVVDASCIISGVAPRGHRETVVGIQNLVKAGVDVMLNCVLTEHNMDHLVEYVDYCVETFGADVPLKFVYPTVTGKGGGWSAIHFPYSRVDTLLLELQRRGKDLGVPIFFENIPNCILGDRRAKSIGRSGFGESHYVDDLTGRDVYSMKHIESVFNAFPESCRDCAVVQHCPGVARTYLDTYGGDEFIPMTSGS